MNPCYAQNRFYKRALRHTLLPMEYSLSYSLLDDKLNLSLIDKEGARLAISIDGPEAAKFAAFIQRCQEDLKRRSLQTDKVYELPE